MWHDFQLYAGLVRDATQSVEEIALFIQEAQARADASITKSSASGEAGTYTRAAAISSSAMP
jgi:hypothetical protein